MVLVLRVLVLRARFIFRSGSGGSRVGVAAAALGWGCREEPRTLEIPRAFAEIRYLLGAFPLLQLGDRLTKSCQL